MHSFSSLIFLTFKVFSWICSCLFVLLPPGAVEVVLSPRLAEVFRKSNHLITHWLFSHFHPLGVSNMTPLSHRSEVWLMFKIIPGLAPPPLRACLASPHSDGAGRFRTRAASAQTAYFCVIRDVRTLRARLHQKHLKLAGIQAPRTNGGHRFRGRGHYIIQFRPHWRASCCCCWLLDIRGVLLFCIFSLTSPTKPVFSQMRCIHGVGASPTANEKAKSLLDSLVSCAVRLAASNPVFKSLCVVAAYLQRALLQNCALWKTLGSLGDFLSFRSRNTFGCSLCKYILLWFKSS